jgi:hypothetical protein
MNTEARTLPCTLPLPFVGNLKYGLRSGARVDRETKWGNPHWARSRTENIEAYARYLLTRPDLLAALPELRGRNLVCWCAPLPCHADVLVWLANGNIETNIAALRAWAARPA